MNFKRDYKVMQEQEAQALALINDYLKEAKRLGLTVHIMEAESGTLGNGVAIGAGLRFTCIGPNNEKCQAAVEALSAIAREYDSRRRI